MSQGLSVLASHAGRRTLDISGTAEQMNAAFGVQLNHYESPRRVSKRRAAETHIHRGYDGEVHIPSSLTGIVTAVIGLDNRAPGGAGASSGDPPNANQLAVPKAAGLYNFPNSGAADQVIGVIAPSDPVGTTNQRLSGYLANDINNNYFPNLSDTNFRTVPASLSDINLTVGTHTYTNSTTSVTAITSTTLNNGTASAFALEVTQDNSTAATTAQGAAVNVYFTELTEQGLLVCLNRILLPEGESQPTVVTCSFNFFNTDDSGSIGDAGDTGSAAFQMSALFQQLALLGVGVFIIAQDLGSNDGDNDGNTHLCYPGSDPWVTSVGGTVIGNINNGPPVTFDEVVWSNVDSKTPVGGFGGATGGGASENFPIPAYQTSAGITSITDSNGNKHSKRFIPDVAGMVSYGGSGSNDWFFINGLEFHFTGTSCTCPLFAGLYATLRSAFGIPLGFFNPVLYQIGGTVCNDITSGNNDPADGSNAPFYTAAAGWDPCTGWGSIDGTKLLNGIAALLFTQTFYFQNEKSTYGFDEVSVSSSYSPAFWLVLEGFTFTAAQNIAPTLSGAFFAQNGVTITVGAATPEISSQPGTPQRVLYPCGISFAALAVNTVANGGVFPASGAVSSLPLTAQITIGGQTFVAATVFELGGGADPFFANFNATGTNAFYLSEDLRVFTVTPGITNAPIAGVPLLPASNNSFDSGAAYNYIQVLLAVLTANNSDATGADVFTSLPDQSGALVGDSSVTPNSVNPADATGARFSNYNFAVARVRLNGAPNTSSVSNVPAFRPLKPPAALRPTSFSRSRLRKLRS